MQVSDGNGGARTKLEIERKDHYKIIGLGLSGAGLLMAIVTAIAVPLLTSYFQTRTQAAIEHAVIEQTAAVAAEKARNVEAKNKKQDDAIEEACALLNVIASDQRVVMDRLRIQESKRTQIPAGMSIDLSKMIGVDQ